MNATSRFVLTDAEATLQTEHETLARPAFGACPVSEWYVVEAEHQKLSRAIQSVESLGFQTYSPQILIKIRDTVNGKRNSHFSDVARPMFFQFFFVAFDDDRDSWGRIRREPSNGIRRLLMSPGQIPARADRGRGIRIEVLKSTEAERLKLPDRGLPRIKRGGFALVVRGPLEGHVVQIEACDGFTTTAWATIFSGRTRVMLKRMDLTDE